MKFWNATTNQYEELTIKALDSMPIGVVIAYIGTTIPTGWLECDGDAISQQQYPELYNLIGDTLPDLRGRVIVGQDTSDTDFDTIGATGGEKTHTLTIDEMPRHTHQQCRGYQTAGFEAGYSGTMSGWGLVDNITSGVYINNIVPAGNSQPHNNMPPYIVAKWIIKAKNTTPTMASIVDAYSTSTTDGYSCNYVNGDVLYNNSTGTSGDIILSSAIEDYSTFKVYFSGVDGYIGISEFFVLSGSTYAIDKNRIDSGELKILQEKIQISGTSLTSLTNRTYSTISGIVNDNPIKIFKIIGYK